MHELICEKKNAKKKTCVRSATGKNEMVAYLQHFRVIQTQSIKQRERNGQKRETVVNYGEQRKKKAVRTTSDEVKA